MKKLYTSSYGLTLVELLMGLALISIISLIIISYILSGMNSYEKTSDEVLLKNDANYVMTLFVNEIYQANTVEPLAEGSSIKLESLNRIKTLGFQSNKAFISDRGDLSSHYFTDESYVVVNNNKVEIMLVIENDQSKFELKNEVSFGMFETE